MCKCITKSLCYIPETQHCKSIIFQLKKKFLGAPWWSSGEDSAVCSGPGSISGKTTEIQQAAGHGQDLKKESLKIQIDFLRLKTGQEMSN